MDNYLLLTCQF